MAIILQWKELSYLCFFCVHAVEEEKGGIAPNKNQNKAQGYMAHSKSFCLDGLKMACRGEDEVIVDTERRYQNALCMSANNGTY